jgi:hypothetical protein
MYLQLIGTYVVISMMNLDKPDRCLFSDILILNTNKK